MPNLSRDWKTFNKFHFNPSHEGNEYKHAKLLVYVHDNPELTYSQYQMKAMQSGISYMTEEKMNELGFCLNS